MIRYLLIASALFNCVLIITLTGIVPFLLFLSACLNIVFVWYIKTLLDQMNDINDDIEEMFSTFDDFTKHIESVYQLELFYGDDTLESVINHSRNVLDEINEYRQKFYLDGEIVDPDLLEDDKEEDFDTEEKEEEQ